MHPLLQISVEAWILSDRGVLMRPRSAFWFDPIIVREHADSEALMRLVDESRDDFVNPDPLAPGVGLAGAIWSELDKNTAFMNPIGRQSALGRQSARANRQSRRLTGGAANLFEKHVVWREVEPIANDPDQPYNLRLKVAVEAGIGLAAGVKFDFHGTAGLVLYMAHG
mmetsp:Transcript_26138/g.62763  ORF Transcript_26138/g.62763 Transcript_26138/m.62763 type:complete len:168 (+) Transcript_26138:366-869(+)